MHQAVDSRREFSKFPAAVRVFAVTVAAVGIVLAPAHAGEKLYNGIELPVEWPPRQGTFKYEDFRNGQDRTYEAPMPVPYLEDPPEVIPIDVGRQLFVDDFLIQNTNLKRTYHVADYHPASPVLIPDQSWEQRGEAPRAMVYSDGVWYDPTEKRFKMWYYCNRNGQNATGYAVSEDGIHWIKPQLDAVEPGTNIVMKQRREANTVWLDLSEPDPTRRYKAFVCQRQPVEGFPPYTCRMGVSFSRDGIDWSNPLFASTPLRDRSTVFHNPFRNVWVYSIKYRPVVDATRHPERKYRYLTRSRAYRESTDVTARWNSDEIVPWVGADRLDPPRNSGIDKQTLAGQHLYNLDAVAYESILLGMFSMFHGDGTTRGRRHHMNDVTLGYSRDGFHWHRPDRRAFLGVGEKETDWNWSNVQSAGGCCLVVGDKLHFYVSGRTPAGLCSTGLATLRRDGFVSMNAGAQEGVLITRPIRFAGKYLFVNADCSDGALRVDVLRENFADTFENSGPVIEPFSRANCVPIRSDRTLQQVRWKGVQDLSAVAQKPVRFRFHLLNGKLYSFWVSPQRSGASHGYVAAGGPGYTESTDTVGQASMP